MPLVPWNSPISFSNLVRKGELLMEFMLTLDRHRDEFAPELRGEETYTDSVMRRMIMVTDHIKHNLTADDLSQGAMAEMAGISKDYFSRIFRNVTGMNYSKWLNTIRLEKATELLADREKTLAADREIRERYS